MKGMSNDELCLAWLDWLRTKRHCVPETVYGYKCRLESFLDWIGPLRLEDVPLEEMEAFVARRRMGRARGRAGAPATQAQDVTILHGLYSFLHARGYIDRNPSVLLVAPPIRNVMPKPVPESIWAHIWNHEHMDDEAALVFGLAFFAGLRRQEIVRLAPHHVNTQSGLLSGYTRKGGGQDATPYRQMAELFEERLPHLAPGGVSRFVRAVEGLAEEREGCARLLDWSERRGPSEAAHRKHQLGPSDVDPQQVNRRMRTWLSMFGLPRDCVTPHMLRHGTATYLLQADVPVHLVSRLLNHSSLDMTMRYVRAGAHEFGQWRAQTGPAGGSGMSLRATHLNRL